MSKGMRIVTGPLSGAPILILPGNKYMYLGMGMRGHMSGPVGELRTLQDPKSAILDGTPYPVPLTDEQEALAMKAILLHG